MGKSAIAFFNPRAHPWVHIEEIYFTPTRAITNSVKNAVFKHIGNQFKPTLNGLKAS
jgi:predicted pyridoxine 5'-phosphate oxidase superfamily flavin-nucleotide-binding protein